MDWMECTPGITEPNLTKDPLGTEGEMSPGPDDENPYDDSELDTDETEEEIDEMTDRQPDLGVEPFSGLGDGPLF